jgi:hypothetical protein
VVARQRESAAEAGLREDVPTTRVPRRVERDLDLADAAPILAALPTETPIGEAVLAGSTAHIAESSVPDAVLDVMLCSVRGASVVRGLVPKALAGSATEFYEAAVTDDSATLELVLDGAVFDRLYGLNPQETKDALDKPSVTLFRGTIPWTFGL